MKRRKAGNICYPVFLVLLCWLHLAAVASEKNTVIHSGDTGIKPTATRGMVIDAGSGGSRLHVYQWKPRIFSSVPPPLSYPEANEHWTARMDPGIHTFADNLAGIEQHLAPLIDFAKVSLVGNEADFGDYPIYFKATGGMRELPVDKREAIITQVQKYLSDKTFCPFYFRNDFARVISGEEEAIFSWTATNFLKGTLLAASHGIGEVKDVNTTYGTLDLGGASTQIAFYLPSQDILDGMFKLQIGGQKEWNVYTKSFLQFGITSARIRHMRAVAEAYISTSKPSASQSMTIEAACLHAGYSEHLTVDDDNPITGVLSNYNTAGMVMRGPAAPVPNQFATCKESLKPLMEKRQGTFCNQVYHGDCSIAGTYQPPIPHGVGSFLGTSTYKYAWTFLQLDETASLDQLEAKAAALCQYNYAELLLYYNTNAIKSDSDKMTDIIPYSCFISAYISVLLQDGYGFRHNDTITVIDTINGNKVGWALGAILYEINELPWVLQLSAMETHPFSFVILAAVGGFALGIVAAVIVYREILADKYHYLNEAYQHANSPGARAHYLYYKYHNMSQDEEHHEEHGELRPELERTRSRSGSLFDSLTSAIGFGPTASPPKDDPKSKHEPKGPGLSATAPNEASQSRLMSYYSEYCKRNNISVVDLDHALSVADLQLPGHRETGGLIPEQDSDKDFAAHRPTNLHVSIPASSSSRAQPYSIYTPANNKAGWMNWVDTSRPQATTSSSDALHQTITSTSSDFGGYGSILKG